MLRRFVPLLVLLNTVAYAHWTAHPELPDWAQRGKLRWCLHYARADRKLVDLFLEAHQTLLHGGTFDSPETAEYARQHGLRYMPYVCSRTTTLDEIARNPQLKGSMVLKADGTEVLAYNNPVRRYGSLYQPAWPEWVRERTRRQWDLPDVAGIFYDNAFWELNDYNPATAAAWVRWAQARGLQPGVTLPTAPDDPLTAAARLFAAESLTDYHRGLQQFCHSHNPPLVNCPNLGSGAGLETIEAGAVDLVFYETASHPPFENNFYLYKAGLAASHGRPTGMLAYLPDNVGSDRGERTWHEGMHSYFHPSSPMAEEFALAVAEAAAADGIYIPCYNLFPSLPITDLGDPFNKRIYRELRRSYSFQAANEALYAGAQPGSEIAILHSTLTGLHSRRLQNGPALAQALLNAGIPFEVVAASDLADGLGRTRTLIVPSAAYMQESTARDLLRFVQGGGRAVLTGECGALDPLGRPLHSESMDRLNAVLRLVSRPIQQWKLQGMAAEGPTVVKATAPQGTAELPFSGKAGRYVAYITITDESDGTSPFSLSVGDRTVFSARLDRDDDQPRLFTTPPFALAPGDTVSLTVQPDGGEPGRVQSVLLTAADATTGADLGAGRVSYSPVGLEKLGAPALTALLQPRLSLGNPQHVSANLTLLPQGRQAIHLVNYDFRYEVAHPGRYASDDGKAERRTFFGKDTTVLRKRVHIPDPAKVVDPVVEVQATATPDTTADLVVAVNGRPGARLPAATLRGGWAEARLDPALLQQDNVLELRVDGAVDGLQRWIQVGIDTDNRGNSEFSTDGGKTFTADDLSPDLQAQTGEYLIRITDRDPGGERGGAASAVRNGGFERVKVPHAETKLTVVPAQAVQVRVQGAPQEALAISPEQEPQWIAGRRVGAQTCYTVTRVDIYTVLVLGPSRSVLQPLYQAQVAAATWKVPPVTEPLRPVVTGWEAFGEGFTLAEGAGRDGGNAVTCRNGAAGDLRGAVQTLELNDTVRREYTFSAWSKADKASGGAAGDYSLYLDATCADGSVYNGHSAGFAPGTHDWQQAILKVAPPAPLKSARLYVLFRKQTGQVWFDDVSAQAVPAP